MAATKTVAERLSGVDVDALLKLADEISVLVDVPPYKAHSVPASIARMWKHDIRNAAKNAKPQLPEGIEWPRFEDGELVKFGASSYRGMAKRTRFAPWIVNSIDVKGGE